MIKIRKLKLLPYDPMLMQVGAKWGITDWFEMRVAWDYYNAQARRPRKDIHGKPIEMRLTFEQWFDIWMESGKWHLRGREKGCYCMARKGDTGHYELGNVSIVPGKTNRQDAYTNNPDACILRKQKRWPNKKFEN